MAEQSLIDSPFKCPWCLHLDTDHDPLPVGCTQCDCRHSAVDGLTIDTERYLNDQRCHEIGDRILATYGYDAKDVVEVRITTGRIEVDVIGPSPYFHTRTIVHEQAG